MCTHLHGFLFLNTLTQAKGHWEKEEEEEEGGEEAQKNTGEGAADGRGVTTLSREYSRTVFFF